MFTGIIECTGRIARIRREGSNVEFLVESPISGELKVDQSVAHDGVCLTVTSLVPGGHTVTLIEETLLRSHFATAREGQLVNIERAVSLQHRLDGHLVQGHVDGQLECLSREERNGSWEFRFRFAPEHAHLLIDKGSVCIDGVSLTVVRPDRESFGVAIIPYTYMHTGFCRLEPGDQCNVEFDLVAKYLARWRELDAAP